MVVSVAYRPNLQNRLSKKFIQRQCTKLIKCNKAIAKIKITFSAVSCKNKSSKKILCHVSIHLATRRYINIHVNNSNSGNAFLEAIDSSKKMLSNIKPNTMQQKKKIIQFMRHAECDDQTA